MRGAHSAGVLKLTPGFERDASLLSGCANAAPARMGLQQFMERHGFGVTWANYLPPHIPGHSQNKRFPVPAEITPHRVSAKINAVQDCTAGLVIPGRKIRHLRSYNR